MQVVALASGGCEPAGVTAPAGSHPPLAERCQDINSTIAQAKSTMDVIGTVGKVAAKKYAGH